PFGICARRPGDRRGKSGLRPQRSRPMGSPMMSPQVPSGRRRRISIAFCSMGMDRPSSPSDEPSKLVYNIAVSSVATTWTTRPCMWVFASINPATTPPAAVRCACTADPGSITTGRCCQAELAASIFRQLSPPSRKESLRPSLILLVLLSSAAPLAAQQQDDALDALLEPGVRVRITIPQLSRWTGRLHSVDSESLTLLDDEGRP